MTWPRRSRRRRWRNGVVGALLGCLGAACLLNALAAAEDAADSAPRPFAMLSSEPVAGPIVPAQGRDARCRCYTANDRILVHRTAGDVPVSAALDQPSDFRDALWLIDAGVRGHPQIAVWFHDVDGLLVGDVFQDQDGDGDVAWRPDGDRPVSESAFFSIRVVARDGYWQRDGRLAPNLDLFVDDRIAPAFNANTYLDSMANDGRIDATIRVRGPRSGDPRSFDWRDVDPPMPKRAGFLRTTLTVRERGLEPTFAPVFPWYPLGFSNEGTASAVADPAPAAVPRDHLPIQHAGFDRPYGTTTPPLQVDWDAGRVALIGEMVTSRWSDDTWFTYSINRVAADTVTNPNFESPFAFYDLADDDDAVPEMIVRAERIVANDPTIVNPSWVGRANQKVRYAWDQDNTQNWSFKLGLLGQHRIESVVPFPGFTLQTVPYDEFPDWVTERPWDVAAFVAAERDLWTSEGIYAWDGSGPVRDAYYAGTSSDDDDLFPELAPGLRGDYALDLGDRPWLTFNPVDRQLHLAGAETGIWALEDGGRIRYLSSSKQTFDGWQRWDGGLLSAELYRVPGGLLYSDARETLFRAVEIPAELFRTLPPTDHAEWAALGSLLDEHERDLPPGDLRAMFDAVGGDAIRVAAAPLSGFRRLDGGGARFAVSAADAEGRGLLSRLAGRPVGAGMQVVTRDGAGWSVVAGGAAAPSVTVALVESPRSTIPRALDHAGLRVEAANPGTLDLGPVRLVVEAAGPGGASATLARRENLTLDGEAGLVEDLNWTPAVPGSWRVEARIERAGIGVYDAAPVVLARAELRQEIAASPALGIAESAAVGWATTAPWRLAGFAALVLTAATIALVAVRAGGRTV